MYARKVLLKERMHYTNGTTFTNTAGKPLIASSANAWTITYDSITGGLITSPAAGAIRYLTNTRTFTPTTSMIFEFDGQASAWTTATNGTEGFGMIFMANGTAGSFTVAYRARQTNGSLFVEKLGGGTWSKLWSTNATAGLNDSYYYRIYYSKSALTLYDWTSPFTAGSFFIFRGYSQDQMGYVDTFTDAIPLTTGSYVGLFKGSGTTFHSHHFGAYQNWEMDDLKVEWTHEANKESTAAIEFTRNPDQINTRTTVNDRWEIWSGEFDEENGTTKLFCVFDGSAERDGQRNRQALELRGWTRELTDLQWFNGTGISGTILSNLSTVLASSGGQFNISTAPTTRKTHVLHACGLDPTITQETSRDISGKSADIVFKQMVTEGQSFFFFCPDGRFLVRNTLIAAPSVLDTTSEYLNVLGYEIWKDGRQIVNTSDGYYQGYTTPNTYQNGTANSVGVYGLRCRPHIDMMQKSSTYMGNAQMMNVNTQCRNDYIFKISLAQQKFDFLPGMAVTVKLAGTTFGTNNGSTDTDTWSAEKCSLFKTHYSSETGVHDLYLTYNGTALSATAIMFMGWPTDNHQVEQNKVIQHIGSMETI